ncbi:hypothetical protein BZZ01_18885 [Nostocales cyanobacterium HT-58-2]|nr:hypothetical protein BZZ01_18885 [Nostocales cyanobacterium HT-58-2]
MGRYERRPDNPRAKGDPSGAAETALRAVTEELQILQRNLLQSLQEDIKRLQAEKDRLTDDITRLQEEKEHLQQGRQITEQQALIRQLSQVLANHISSQLQSSLETLANQATGSVSQPFGSSEVAQSTSSSASEVNEYAEKLLGSLDDTLTITFNSLQQELKNYQSHVSQQLSRMIVQQREGEAILIELVNRLRRELEETTEETALLEIGQNGTSQGAMLLEGTTQTPAPYVLQTGSLGEECLYQEKVIPPVPSTEIEQTRQQQQQSASPGVPTKLQTDIPSETTVLPSSYIEEETQNIVSPSETTESPSVLEPTPEPSPPEPTVLEKKTLPPPKPLVTPKQLIPRQPLQTQTGISLPQITGIILLVLSTVASALYNVVIKVIFLPGTQIFGVFDADRLISSTLGNCFLILLLRMLVVVPLMLLLAPILHSRVWQDLQYLSDSFKGSSTNSTGKQVLLLSIISGCFLFISQVLIYLAIGQVPTGIAIALFFVYPVINGLLSRFLFRDSSGGSRSGSDRLTLFSFVAMSAISLGELLVLGGSAGNFTGNIPLGSLAALAAGTAFAFYLIFSRVGAAKLHPVSLTLVNFVTMLLLSVFGLLLPLPTNSKVQLNPAYFLELVLCAFLLGVLTLSSYLLNNFGIRKIGASRSAILGTTIPALTVIFAGLIIQEVLQLEQVLGVLIVTFGAATLCFEKIRNRMKPHNNSFQ